MAAPEFVPLRPVRGEPAYESPPRRPESWCADRPAELVGAAQPAGSSLGNQGPDQGYALLLANSLRDRLTLAPGEEADDVIAGCLAVALRRASLFGRAPIMHDVRLALELFGFLDDSVDEDKLAYRRPIFEGLGNPHHYFEVRHLAASVPEATLRLRPDDVRARAAQWRTLLGV
jgi:hypothetical protein